MKKFISLLLIVIGGSHFAIAQNETFHLTNPTLIECNLIRSTPPIHTLSNADAPMGPNYRSAFKGIDKDDEGGQIKLHPAVNPNALPKGISPAVQLNYNSPDNFRSPATLNLQFPGLGYTGVNPSDNNMASGPNHIVQMINNNSSSLIRIWDKVGNIIIGSIILSTITGHSGLGDPVVLYDELANRYLISEFSNTGNHIYICVSQTADPTGAYFVYDYTTPQFPDYFKLAAWGNSYIVTTNENSPAIYALDRTKMLAGTATTTVQRFTIPSYPTIGFQSATPVDICGTTNAPAGSPALFMRMADDAWTSGIVDRLEIFSLNVDWVTPANTTLTGPALLPTLPFSTNFCGYTTFSCIPQQGSTVRLDPLREVLMNKILYRNFGTYESIVCTHIDELDGNSHAGVRWYELRRPTPTSNWVIHQQSTYGQPSDPLHRWMSCIGINSDNSIGLGYNVAGPTSFPSIRFTGRKDCDPLGVMTEPEQTVIAGTAPNASIRYGDYNGMTVDPINGSFWFTANYNPAPQWATRVANFTINSCATNPSFTFVTPTPTTVTCGTATAAITLATTSVSGFVTPINLVASGNPGGTTVTYSVNPVVPGNSTVVTLNGMATLSPGTYNVTITGTAGAEVKTVMLSYIVSAGAGPAITAQPAPQTVCAGTNTSFNISSATATGFQWQLSTAGAGGPWSNISNGGVYSGATTATLTLTGILATMDTYQYRCVASVQCGSTNSNAALLTVQTAPAITSQPVNSTVCGSSSSGFNITASGAGLSYQWQISTTGCGGAWTNLANAAPYSGVTTNTLSINPTTTAMNGYAYRCVVTGTCAPAATSGCGLLTVNTPITISSQPSASTICAGAQTSFTVGAAGTTPAYQWQESTNGGGTWANITNGGVYSGATTAILTLTGVTAGMTGYQYRAVVNGTAPCGSATSNAAILTVNTAPAITIHPTTPPTLCVGNNINYTVAANGTALTYQWQLSTAGAGGPWSNIANGGVYTGATTSTLTITGVTAVMSGSFYRAVISGTCAPAANSNAATIQVNTPITITTQPAANTNICATGSTSFTTIATSIPSPGYQWQESTNAGVSWTNVTNGGVYSGAATNTLTLTAVTAAMNGYQYRTVITVAAPCPSVNSNIAVLNVTPQPVISATPTAILAGQQTILTVNVTPAPGLSFAWYLNGVLIAGATGNSIVATVNSLGSYRVIVSSGTGSCQSELKEITAEPSTNLFVFPSPNNGLFKVTYYTAGASATNPTKQSITIYDSYGRRVLNKEYPITQAYQLHQIDLRRNGSGVYYIVLREANGNKIKTGEAVVR